MNDNEWLRSEAPKSLYLLDPAQGLFTLEGNISRRALVSCERSPGVTGTSARATHHVINATSEALWFLVARNFQLRPPTQVCGCHRVNVTRRSTKP